MNTDVFVGDDFKVTINPIRLENYLTFETAISFETALDAYALNNPEQLQAIGRSLITELYNKHELWLQKGKL
jgi:hypothetical protein